jgi:NAD(P)-dependent dehydrogenase (short-subunit alcohol dehydrogenase family)
VSSLFGDPGIHRGQRDLDRRTGSVGCEGIFCPATRTCAGRRGPCSLPQSLRALLAGRGVRVHAVLTGPVDTEMSRGLDVPKASPDSVARAIFDGVEKGEEDIFPDPMSNSLAESWRSGAVKALERQFAALVPPRPVQR